MQDSDIKSKSSDKSLNIYRYIQFFVGLVVFVAMLSIENNRSARDWINWKVNHALLFQMREVIGKTPKLSPELKIYALDDETVSFIGGASLDLYDFSLLMKSISKKKPKSNYT